MDCKFTTHHHHHPQINTLIWLNFKSFLCSSNTGLAPGRRKGWIFLCINHEKFILNFYDQLINSVSALIFSKSAVQRSVTKYQWRCNWYARYSRKHSTVVHFPKVAKLKCLALSKLLYFIANWPYNCVLLDGVSNPLLLKPVMTFPPFPLMEVTRQRNMH
jgi:hypothetical protein